ncbi:CoA-binding protein [Stratiformator vulcanicus]|uniref:CoA-binding domain-containing protein n=1 Tax=Stratiformator vulcanicus TaxID=2527980 RepID=A0A517R2X3_9PLAN|nr:CoA-binding protein [Stratiformator vulcanicus]QDT38193.1 hypothetical protein Pan189_25830 [Stratiformator vulcanicus]
MSEQKTVAVLGASRDRSKFGNKSVRAHASNGYAVYPINPKADEIEGHTAYKSLDDLPIESIDRVTVYLPPAVLIGELEAIGRKRPTEIFLNPGCESSEVLAKAKELDLPVIQACSIIDVGAHPANL